MSENNRRDGVGGTRLGRRGLGMSHAAGIPLERAKDFKGTLKRLGQYLKPQKIKLIIVLFAAICSTIFSVLSPKIMGRATTKLFEGLIQKDNRIAGAMIDFDYIFKIILILIGLYILSFIFGFIQQYIMAGAAQKTVYSMRKQVDMKLNKLPLKYFDSRSRGDVLSRVTNDIDLVSTTLQQSITQIITSIVTIIGVIIMMLTISPILTVVTLVVLPLSVGVVKKSHHVHSNISKNNRRN